MSVRSVKNIVFAVLVVAYPFLVYWLTTIGLPGLSSALVLGIIVWQLRGNANWVWWVVGLLGSALLIAMLFGSAVIAKLVPFGIHVSLFLVFWRSLRTTPLIERYARLDFPVLPPEICEYVRRLTIVWAVFFALNAAICLVLALSQNEELWALYNGLLIYLLIGLLFVGEFIWRKIRFPGLETPPFRESLQRMIRYGRDVHGR